jgi:hypothetical protein
MAREVEPELASLSRRDALKLGSAAAGGVLLAGVASSGQRAGAATATAGGETPNRLPVAAIEKIIGAQGTVSDGVLSIEVDRDDIGTVHNSYGVAIKPSFEVNGTLVFQSLGDHDHDGDDRHGAAMLNGDLPFLPHELQPALDQMQSHGLTFQAMHQHFYDWNPMVWFMHFRGQGDPRRLATGVAAILSTTATPLPQTSPSNPTTPLDTKRLAKIIGASPTVGADGVVTFDIPRRESLRLGGTHINPFLNVATTVAFEPLASTTAVVVDFGMIASEIQPLTKLMRSLGWQVGCLYNQETDEYPQLYFSHQFKSGDPYRLAAEIRRGLDRLNVKLS